MRTSAKYSGVAVLLISVVMLAGCVTGGAKGAVVNSVDKELTLEGAKKAAMAMEREIAAMVPADTVISIDQHQSGVLLSCDGDRAYQWTGQTNVAVASQPNADAIVDAIVDRYKKAEGFTARRETRVDGQPRAHVIGAYGAGYLVGPGVETPAIEISSFSPCFVLPEDMSPGDTY